MAEEKKLADASGTSSDTGGKLEKNDLVGGPSGSANPDGGLKGRHDPDGVEGGRLKGKALLEAAQLKAPNLSQAYVSAYKLTDDELQAIADGLVPPPPVIGPQHSSDLYLTPGGWQQTPPGVKPEDVGKNAISR